MLLNILKNDIDFFKAVIIVEYQSIFFISYF